jgi:ribonuclease J
MAYRTLTDVFKDSYEEEDMKVCIHRGTHEIGGTCVEIESKGDRIVLDIGLPLDVDEVDAPLPPVRGFLEADDSLLGVIISHPHADHYGLAPRLLPGTEVLIGEAARRILEAASQFFPSRLTFQKVGHLKDRKTIEIGSFKITPFLVDHSAYDAYSVLVEADGKRLFYSGDFRGHGRKGKLFERLLANPPQSIDALLLEGTTIGREVGTGACQTENDLEGEFEKLFAKAQGLTMVWCSGQNIDRIVTIYRAARHMRKQVVVDMYTASILKAIGNPKIPQPGFDGFRVYLPLNQKKTIVRKKMFDLSNSFAPYRIYPEDFASEASRTVMLFRPSMMKELEKAECLKGAQVIYSLWGGYLKDIRQQPFLDWLASNQIPMTTCHCSGHAPLADLRRFAEAIGASKVIPIHTTQPEQYEESFQRVEPKEDGLWWEV